MPEASAGSNSQSTILVCDDDRDTRTVTRIALEADGFQVCEAEHGLAAQKICREKLPDLIILDLMMPQMSGLEFLAAFRKEVTEPFVPVLLLTALSDTNKKVEGFKLGADDYLVKPFERRELMARIRSLLKIREMQLQLVAQERELLKAQLAGAAAHELGQPLQSVLLQLHVLLKKIGSTPEAQEAAAAIRAECERMQDILTRLQKSSAGETSDYPGAQKILKL